MKNWPVYDIALRKRGDITFWFDEDAVDAWNASPNGRPGGQRHYSELPLGQLGEQQRHSEGEDEEQDDACDGLPAGSHSLGRELQPCTNALAIREGVGRAYNEQGDAAKGGGAVHARVL